MDFWSVDEDLYQNGSHHEQFTAQQILLEQQMLGTHRFGVDMDMNYTEPTGLALGDFDSPILIIRTFAEAGVGRVNSNLPPRNAAARVSEILNRLTYLRSKDGMDLPTLRKAVKFDYDEEKTFDRDVRIQTRIEAERVQKAKMEIQPPTRCFCPRHNCVHFTPKPFNYDRVSEWPVPDARYRYSSEQQQQRPHTTRCHQPMKSNQELDKQCHWPPIQPQRLSTSSANVTMDFSAGRTETRRPASKVGTGSSSTSTDSASQANSISYPMDPTAIPNSDEEREMNSYYHRAISLKKKGEMYRPSRTATTAKPNN